MKVIFLGQLHILKPWYDDFLAGVNGEHEVALYDPTRPLEPQFEGVDVVVDQGGAVGTHAMMDLAARGGVKLWQVIGTGLDHVDVKYILKRGLRLANTPGQFSAIALAEHALFMMLFLAKKFRATQKVMEAGKLCQPMCEELGGKTLAMIGFGASARELAKRVRPLGMRMVAVDAVRLGPETAREYGLDFLGEIGDLDKVLEGADYVSLHVPLTSATHQMIGREALARLKPEAKIINVARGEIIDQDALVEALKGGRLAGAGLDVFYPEPLDPGHELLKLESVIATPHVAGMTAGTSRRRGAAAAENVRRVAAGEPILYEVKSAE